MKGNARLASQPRLPPELVDMVIDHLHYDKLSLANCTQVAHSWLSAARMHLFRDVMVYHDRSDAPFSKFASFLRSAGHIRVLIKTLCINGYHASDRSHGKLDATILESVISHLPTLDTLLVVNSFWETGGQRAPLVPKTRMSLKNLYITYFAAPGESANAKLEILRHFTHVDCLKLDHVWLGHPDVDDRDDDAEDDTTAVTELSARLRVTSLTLSLADICLNFLIFLWRQSFMLSLTSLTVQDLYHASYLENHEDLMLLGSALRHTFGPQLTYFELDIPRLQEADSAERFYELNLAHCTALTSVRLNMVLRTTTSADAEAEAEENAEVEDALAHDTEVKAAAEEGAQVASQPVITAYTEEEWHSLHVLVRSLPPTLKTLTLAIEFPLVDASWNFDVAPHWPALRQALGRFANLERLIVLRRLSKEGYVYDMDMDADTQALVRRNLTGVPRLESILVFEGHQA